MVSSLSVEIHSFKFTISIFLGQDHFHSFLHRAEGLFTYAESTSVWESLPHLETQQLAPVLECSPAWWRPCSCNCTSLQAVGQWCRDQQLLLRRLFGPRDFSTPTGSLYRRRLSRLSVGHLEVALAAWVQASRPDNDEEAVALDGKAVRGAVTSKHKAPHLLALCTHDSQETLLQVRISEKTNEIPLAKAVLPCLPRLPRVSTADGLHTHADFMEVAHAHCGACALSVKGNQPNL